MANEIIANRYAICLLELSQEKNILKEVFADIQLLLSNIQNNAQFAQMLASPIDFNNAKIKIIENVFATHIQPVSFQFLQLLIKKKRENILKEIAHSFIKLYNQLLEIHTIQFTTATPIDESLVNKITTKLQSEKNIKHVHVETNLDPSLIGGFVIEFDNQQLDASIKKDLNDIKKQFQKNEFIQTIK